MSGEDYVVALCDLFDVVHHLPTGSRIKTAGGLIQEQDLRGSDQLSGDTGTALLPSTNTLSNGGSNNSMCLISQAK
jgi:hypothetical protein